MSITTSNTTTLNQEEMLKLQLHANTLRQDIIRMVYTAQSGHPGGALGMADIFAVLYWQVLKHQPAEPSWPERDYLLLSNGHTCPVLYAALAETGYFPVKELLTFRTLGSRLQGHPHLGSLPGIETTSGPLGLGLSQAAGLASALRLDNKDNHVYAVLSDGEHQEGQTWEAYYYAGVRQLGNLTVFIDRNNMQISGHVEQVLPLEPLAEKLKAFRWSVQEVDGHNIPALLAASATALGQHSQPTAIICHTIPGKNVDFMENDPAWHGQAPTKEQALSALAQLQQQEQALKQQLKQQESV